MVHLVCSHSILCELLLLSVGQFFKDSCQTIDTCLASSCLPHFEVYLARSYDASI